jgi:hypothetical protein
VVEASQPWDGPPPLGDHDCGLFVFFLGLDLLLLLISRLGVHLLIVEGLYDRIEIHGRPVGLIMEPLCQATRAARVTASVVVRAKARHCAAVLRNSSARSDI